MVSCYEEEATQAQRRGASGDDVIEEEQQACAAMEERRKGDGRYRVGEVGETELSGYWWTEASLRSRGHCSSGCRAW